MIFSPELLAILFKGLSEIDLSKLPDEVQKEIFSLNMTTLVYAVDAYVKLRQSEKAALTPEMATIYRQLQTLLMGEELVNCTGIILALKDAVTRGQA